MISNVVRQGFNAAQKRLYGFEAVLSNGNVDSLYLNPESVDSLEFPENAHPFISRLVGVAIAVIDVTLECVRPLFLAIESAVFAAISLIAVLWNVLRCDSGSVGRALRVTVLNLHNMLENILVVPFKITMSPFVVLAQILKFLSNPQKTLPSYKVLEWNVGKFFTDEKLDRIQRDLFGSVKIYAGHDSESLVSCMNGHPILSRILALPLSFVDAGLEVVKPIFRIIAYLAVSITCGSMGVIELIKGKGQEGLLSIGLSLNIFGDVSNAIARIITKVIVSPLTIFAQMGSALWDPQEIEPSSEWLYASQKGDIRISYFWIERKTVNSWEQRTDASTTRDNDWEPVSMRNAFPQYFAQQSENSMYQGQVAQQPSRHDISYPVNAQTRRSYMAMHYSDAFNSNNN